MKTSVVPLRPSSRVPHATATPQVSARLLKALLCLPFLSACIAHPDPVFSAGIATMNTDVDWSFLTLGPNDFIRVTVQNHPELSTTSDGVRVDPDGFVVLPEIGAVNVKNHTIVKVNEVVTELYGTILRRPKVTSEVVIYASRHYIVLGHFVEPGMKIMDRPLNALEAAATGGSMLAGADRSSLFLLRPHDDRLEVHNFSLQAPGPDGLVQIRPGDIIYARPTGAWSFQEGLLPALAGLGVNVRNIVPTPLVK